MGTKPINRFVADVVIPFPDNIQGLQVNEWFNIHNSGRKCKRQTEHLHHSREYRFIFEVTENGDWLYVGREG